MDQWLSIEEAAKHLGLGKTNLYALVKAGKVPGNKIGKKWVFEKKQLDAWVRAKRPMESFFIDSEYDIDENKRIREAQREAHAALYQFFKEGGERAVVQIPFYCGKSTLASIIPFGIAEGRVLILTGNAAQAEESFSFMDVSNRQECFWRKRHVLSREDLAAGPYSAVLDSDDRSLYRNSHIVIATQEQSVEDPEKWMDMFDPDFFDLIVLDEVEPALFEDLKTISTRFPNAKIVLLTAVKLRAEMNVFDAELVYRYPFKRGTVSGSIKSIETAYVEPSIPVFTSTSDAATYSLEEVLELSEDEWFERGIGLSEEGTQNVVEKSLDKLRELRRSGTQHSLIALACSVDHAIALRSKYSAEGYGAEIVHADMSDEKRDTIFRKLRSGEIDIVVQAQTFGKLFNHNKLSVAAVFRPFRSFSRFIQFVSQVMPIIRHDEPDHPDNHGFFVSHSDLGLRDRLEEYEELQRDDRDFWEEVLGESGQ